MARKTPRQAAESIINKLAGAGFEALLAGGCVRDLLLGTVPKDYDVATSATPEEVCKIYPHARKVGAHFGVVIVRASGHAIEVATFRQDGKYTDGRHPDQVVFSNAKEDAKRRDFTINGMFYDPARDEIIDYVGGKRDLENKLVQAIGNPERRFEEDHLRMLRAVRFAARLGFHLEQETFEAIYNRAEKIRSVSAERIREELEQILADSNRVDGFDMLCATGLLPHLWSDSRWSTARVKRSHAALAALPDDAGFTLAFAAMLYHLDAAEIAAVCRALATSNKHRKNAVWLSEHLAGAASGEIRTQADLKLLMAGPCFEDLMLLLKAREQAECESPRILESLSARAAAIARDEIAPTPFVSGDDLIRMGLVDGPPFKEILDRIYYRQLNMELADRAAALREAEDLIKQSGG